MRKVIRRFFKRIDGYWNNNLKKELSDTQKYRREMYHFFRRTEWSYETTISRVSVFIRGEKIQLEVETHRPGVLIGKRGHYIDALTKHLREELKEDIVINIKECKIWMNLYR